MSEKLWACIFAGVLALGGGVRLQAQPTNGNGAATQAPVSPETTAKLKELRDSQSAAQAAIRAENLRTGDAEARSELFKLLADPGLPYQIFDGILICLEEKNDRAPNTVDTIIRLWGKAEGSRRKRFQETLQRYDKKLSVVREPLARLRSDEVNGSRAELLDITIALVDTDEERRVVTTALINDLKAKETSPEYARLLDGALRNLTLHTFPNPLAWDAWYLAFAEKHPAGFSERDLALDALDLAREVSRDPLFAVVKRALTALAANKVQPVEFLDPETCDPDVRAFAAMQVAAAAGADEEQGRLALQRLGAVVENDKDRTVRQAAIAALGALAKENAKLRGEIVAATLPKLKDPEPGIVRQTVLTLKLCNDPSAAEALARLYADLKKRGVDPELRREAVSAIAGLKLHGETLLDALCDPDGGVRTAAANSLLVSARPESAEPLAQAFVAEKDPVVQQSLLRTLVQLRNFKPGSVIKALQLATADARLQRDAWIGLMAALAAPEELQPEPNTRSAIADQLVEIYPQQKKESRSFLVAQFGEAPKPALIPVVTKWWLAEPEEEIRLKVAQTFASMPDLEPRVTLELGGILVGAGFGASAEAILQPLITRAPGAEALPPDTVKRARYLLIRALALQQRPELLEQAEKLATDELAKAPDDFDTRRVRGLVRARLKKRKEAVEDLRSVFDAHAAELGATERRQVIAALSELYLDLDQAEESRKILDQADDARGDRQMLYLRALTEMRTGDREKAHGLATEALSLAGTAAESDLLRIQLQTGLLLRNADAHERAAAAFERLGPTVPAIDRKDLEARIALDRKLRGFVEKLDGGDDETQKEAEKGLLEAPAHDAATWLVRNVSDLGASGGRTALSRRLAVLQRLFPRSSKLQSLKPPADAAACPALADALLAWWSSPD